VDEHPINRFAAALGLPGAPKIKFLNKQQKESHMSLPAEHDSEDDSGSSESPSENEAERVSDGGRNVWLYSPSHQFTQAVLGGKSTNQI
jgi:ATP-dependent RNA helicase DDX10/DBP4